MKLADVTSCQRFAETLQRRISSRTTVTHLKAPYQPFCMFEPNIFSFHTCNFTDNHFPKHATGTVNYKCFSYLPGLHWFQFILY
ncbi:hypothetical protein LDENG_00132970 [Lucifuga dentata]|nr:hypothetical protein LDENG_00132970 [Lucifuga dentata]